MLSEGTVGLPASVADGSDVTLRLARTRELVTSSGRSDYAEPGSRGLIYEGLTALTGRRSLPPTTRPWQRLPPPFSLSTILQTLE